MYIINPVGNHGQSAAHLTNKNQMTVFTICNLKGKKDSMSLRVSKCQLQVIFTITQNFGHAWLIIYYHNNHNELMHIYTSESHSKCIYNILLYYNIIAILHKPF